MLDSNGSFDNPFFLDKKIVKIDCKWNGQEYSKDTFGFTHAEYVCSFILKENPEAEIVLVPIVRKNKKSTVLDMIEGIELLIEEQVDIINMSMGDEYKYHKEIEEVCRAAIEKGILIVAAYSNQKAEATYPASFPFVMGVRCLDMEKPVQVLQYDEKKNDVIFSCGLFFLYHLGIPVLHPGNSLNIECGFYILDALKKFCAEKNIEFASGIITNGTLLTAEIVSQLINYNCQQIQITLDGMPDTHNARRKYKDGKGSFEQIISALELLNNKCADIHTVIRINVDKNNLDEVSTLLEYLGINGKGLTNCNVDFGIVRGSTQACSAYSGNCLSESIVGEVLSKLWSKAEMEGFTLYTKPFHRWIYCGLYADSQFTVTPNGELYKCWEHAGDEQHLMGNINENGNIDNIKYSFYDWMSHNPLENEECKECVYLPACGGGCGVVSYNETNSYHSKGCFKVKGVLEKQVLRYFKGKI